MRILVVCLALLLAAGCGSDLETEQETRQAAFQESMRNVVLEGFFTVLREGEEPKPRPERYEIEKAVHVAGDLWTIHARIQYGEHDVTVPVPVKVLWADDTPMISLTDATIPGLGTFSARIVFFRDSYAGMWSHGEGGGSQFGRILRQQAVRQD